MSTQLISHDPSDGSIVGEIAMSSDGEIHAAIANARKALHEWRSLSLKQRRDMVKRAYEAITPQDMKAMTVLLSREMGKDIARSSGEVNGIRWGGPAIADEVLSALQPHSSHGSMIEYGPLGIAAIISPWNYPLAMANNLMVPALVAGNPVIWKPSEETPLIAQKLFDLLQPHLPNHVLQIIHGRGEQGKTLVEGQVDIIGFTGSQAVGRDIMARSAPQLKRLVMELGGKDPLIVLADANINAAARYAVASSFENAGQMCTSIERIYVHQSVADEFIAEATSLAGRYQTGPWDQENVNIGPIINEKQHARIVRQLEDAAEKGANFTLGGAKQQAPYIQPTVVTNVSRNMLLEQEETFGPVVSISTFNDVEEVIERANDSAYGLGASVFGRKDAEMVAGRIDAGMIGVNKGAGGSPWVGAKQSGFGYHGSTEGHRQFAQVRVVNR